MAVAFDRLISEASGTSSVSMPAGGAFLTAGEFVVLWVACDNTAGVNLPNISNITYKGTVQAFTVVASHGSSSASANAATRGFIVIIPSINVSGVGASDIVVAFSVAPSKSVLTGAVFTGVSTTVSGTAASVTGSSTISCTTGTTPAAGDLALGLGSGENNSNMATAFNGDGGVWLQPGGDGEIWTTGGGAAANVSVLGSYKVMSTAIAATFNPTVVGDGGACVVALQAAASGINLAVDNGAHAVSSETPTVTQVHNVATADGAHALISDVVALSQNSNLVTADGAHAVTSDQVAITIVTNLVIADAAHGVTSDTPSLTQVHVLAVDAGNHALTSDQVALTQVHSVLTDNASHTHAADNVALTQTHVIATADAAHAVTSDTVSLSQDAGSINLVVADAAHAVTSETPSLTQVHSVAVADGAHAHSADSVSLTQVHVIAVANGAHAVTSDQVALSGTSNSDLVIADAAHGHLADAVALTQVHSLVTANASHGHTNQVDVLSSRPYFTFESDISGWTDSAGSLAHDTTTAGVGSGSLRLTKDGSGLYPTAILENTVLGDVSCPSGVVTMKWWAKASVARQVFVQVYTDFESFFDDYPVTTSWAEYQFPTSFSGSAIHEVQSGYNDTSPAVGESYWIDNIQAWVAGTVPLFQASNLATNNASHGVTSDTVTLTQVHSLAVSDSLHVVSSDTVSLVQETTPTLVINTGSHGLTSGEVSLSQQHNIAVQDAIHTLVSDNVLADESTAIYILVLNAINEHTRAPQHAIDRVGIKAGLTLYRISGEWYEGRNIRASALDQADLVYRGGYDNQVDDPAIRAELQALGYSFETRYV